MSKALITQNFALNQCENELEETVVIELRAASDAVQICRRQIWRAQFSG
jgi:hypothetical protein